MARIVEMAKLGAAIVRMARKVMPDRDTSGRWSPLLFRRRLPVIVNDQTALTISTVWACIRYIQGNISQLPWTVYQKRINSKGADERPANPTYWLLDKRPNREMSSADFRDLAILCLLLYGNFYAEIEYDNAKRPINLWPIHPHRIYPWRDETGKLYYKVNNTSGVDEVDPALIYHVKGLSYDGVCGVGVIEFAARTMGLSIATEDYGSGFFANSGIPSSVIKHPKNLSKDAQRRLLERLKMKAGVYSSQDTLVLEEGMDFAAIGIPPEQAQFLETRKFTVEDVCRWFGVPPAKVGHLLNVSYNSQEQQALDVLGDCLLPWIRKLELEADYKLLSNNFGGLFSKIETRAWMRTTHKDRSEYYKSMLSTGVVSINDVRGWEDLNPIPDGDLYLVPLNMAPLKDVASGKFQPGAKPADSAPPADTKTQTNEPNPPEPPKVSADEEKRRRRLLNLLDATLEEMELFYRDNADRSVKNENIDPTLLN